MGAARTETPRAGSKTPARKYNNRDRICETALELFNTYGYGSVTTNQIAADSGISPGNLYYHFRNKEEIMGAVYEAAVLDIQQEASFPADEELTPDRCAFYFTNPMAKFWEYRSLFGDVEEIARHPPLAAAQREFMRWGISRIRDLYDVLAAQDRLRKPYPSSETLTMVATNATLILTGWWRFLNTTYDPTELTMASLRQGAVHGWLPIDPYLKPKFASAVRDAIVQEAMSHKEESLLAAPQKAERKSRTQKGKR